MYRHAFWDLGGTLVDTYPQLDEAFCRVVEEHGGSVDPTEVAALTRRSTSTAVAELSRRHGIDPAELRLAHEHLKQQWEHAPAPAVPGAREVVARVHHGGGLNLVITHRDRASATALLEGLGLPVDDLVSAMDGWARKPSPDMHRVLLERHRLDPRQCLAVGDRPIDVVAAHRAGMAAALLRDPRCPGGDRGAEHHPARLAELCDLFPAPGAGA